MNKKSIYRVTGNAFCAGFIVDGKTKMVTNVAPIIARFVFGTLADVQIACNLHGWLLEKVK